MLRPLYDWAMRLAAGRYALPAMAGVAVLEATFPFVPPDVMLAPMCLARRERAFFYAAVCTVCSTIGGCIGYAIGFFASDLAVHIFTLSGHPTALADFQKLFAEVGAGGDPGQGPDACALHAGDPGLGPGPLQPAGVHRRLAGHARRPFLPRGRPCCSIPTPRPSSTST